jgi:uncharacterized protein (UPF0548 family)
MIADRLPFFFARDYCRIRIGHGERAFANARRAFERWTMFDLGWARVANPSVSIAAGQIVAVEAQTLGLWTLNFSRILEVIATPSQFGFVYGTTAMHVEEGEERFLLALDDLSEEVTYTIEAVSRPCHALARIGFPITRAFQHKFVRDSQLRMGQAASTEE